MDGYLHPDFSLVAETLRGQIGRNPGGASACVYHRGKVVLDLWGGARDEWGTPWDESTLAPSFSTTKGVTSTLMHILVDRGLLEYDDPVAMYWPEFAQAGKEKITLRHVMSHQSGLYHLRQILDHADQMLDWETVTSAIAAAEPVHPAGERSGYHGLSYGFIVGEIIQRVAKMPFSEAVRKELAEPLKTDGLFIGAPEEALGRAARLIIPRKGLRMEAGVVVEAAAGLLQTVLGSFGVKTHVGGILELAPGFGDVIYDMIKFIKPEVRVVGTGWVASAATNIYLAAKKENRFSLPNTRYLVHQPSGGSRGDATDIAHSTN
jgi:CubicO group peptidase (beta-lactamase class C family)